MFLGLHFFNTRIVKDIYITTSFIILIVSYMIKNSLTIKIKKVHNEWNASIWCHVHEIFGYYILVISLLILELDMIWYCVWVIYYVNIIMIWFLSWFINAKMLSAFEKQTSTSISTSLFTYTEYYFILIATHICCQSFV